MGIDLLVFATLEQFSSKLSLHFVRWSTLLRSTAVIFLCAAAPVASAQGQDLVPQRRVADVQWPGAGMVEPPPRHSARIATIVAGLRLPVLIPESFAKFKSLDVVSTGPYDYTASVRLRSTKLWINGSRQEVIPPEGAMAAQEFAAPPPGAFVEPDPPEPVVVNRKLERYGVGYVISAECARPSDVHCEDAYLAKLEVSLRLFGGKQ